MSDKKEDGNDPRDQAHLITKEELLKLLDTNQEYGLRYDQINKNQQKYGLNQLKKPEGESIWEKIKEQFEDILVRILLVSAVISFVISMMNNEGGEHEIPAWVEPLVIFVILVANACVGIYQDYDAEKALEALQTLQTQECKVLREGIWQQIDSKQLVPGDIVHVSAGEQLPADIRVLTLHTPCLKVDQSNLTGETNPVNKEDTQAKQDKSATILNNNNMLFSSNLVASGNAVGVVVKTGMDTQIGIVQSLVIDAQQQEQESPLKKRLDEFGGHLANCIFIICILIWVINYPNFFDPVFGSWIKGALYYFKIAVALAVAAIPEGLPAVITTCLALGTRRMAKHRSIVRRLMSVETLGCTTVICSDKTGTLTTNNMTVQQMVTVQPDLTFKSHSVEGVSYDLVGQVSGLDNPKENIQWLLKSMVNCNDSQLVEREGVKGIIGLPTEGALKVLAAKIQLQLTGQPQVEEQGIENLKEPRVATLEFTRKRKGMSVLCTNSQGQRVLYFKSAAEYLIDSCTQVMDNQGQLQTINNKQPFLQQVEQMALDGLRVLAIGVVLPDQLGALKEYNPVNKTPAKVHQMMVDEEYSALETNVVFLGFVGIRDPARPEVPQAIRKCQRAGINVIMITGDNQITAKKIAQLTGIIKPNQDDHVYTGLELENLQINNIRECINNQQGMVFSRTTPYHKRQLVQLLQKEKQIVAMTGDGTNDAPALKTADIGIAMGIAGTDVAKQASDMILADDNFATIVEAVEEGRAIYANMKAFIRYMISSNIGEVFSIFITAVAGLPEGMNSLQLLWVNLVTDGLPATALSFNPPDAHVMKKPPRKHDEGIISGWIFVRYMIIGLYVGLATVGIFVYWYTSYNWSGDGHQLISYSQLSNWSECQNWKDFTVNGFGVYDFSDNPCDYFKWGKQTASTLSLSVLVMIEMLNALNALSEDSSILSMGITCNPWLLLAILGSVLFHCLILYIPLFSQVFGTVPLTKNDWILVFAFSFPVIILDEILKAISRYANRNIYNTNDKLKVE